MLNSSTLETITTMCGEVCVHFRVKETEGSAAAAAADTAPTRIATPLTAVEHVCMWQRTYVRIVRLVIVAR